MSRNRKSSSSGDGALAILLLAIVAMPFVGLYLIASKNASDEDKIVGWILLIISIVIFIAFAVVSA